MGADVGVGLEVGLVVVVVVVGSFGGGRCVEGGGTRTLGVADVLTVGAVTVGLNMVGGGIGVDVSVGSTGGVVTVVPGVKY